MERPVIPLYMEDAQRLKHKSIVTKKGSSEVNKKKYQWVQLNETIFHPKGGGQPCDIGTINGIKVAYVHKLSLDKNRFDLFEILHCFDEEIVLNMDVGDEVDLAIDGSARTLYSRMHTAGHVLAEAVQIAFPQLQPSHGNHDPQDGYVKFKLLEEILINPDEIKQKIQPLLDKWTESPIPIDVIQLPSGMRGVKFLEHVMTCGGTHVAQLNEIGHIFVSNLTVNSKEKTVTVKYHL